MAQPATVNRTYAPLTKGIEFEFAIPWYFNESRSGKIVQSGMEELDFKIIDGCVCVTKQRANLMVPLAHISWSDGMEVARRAVYEVLADNGVDVNEPGPYKYKELPGDEHHRNARNTSAPAYLRWNVTSDGSITGDMPEEAWEENFNTHEDDREWWLVDVELITPAVPAGSKEEDDEIRRVIGIVNDNFHCLYPSSCGLHVHVAQGRELYPLEDLRRIAAAIFGVDIWFKRLHPGHRMISTYARPTRKFSRLAQGATGAWANKVVFGTEPALLHQIDESGDHPIIDPVQAWAEVSVVKDNRGIDMLFSTCSNASYNLSNVANTSKPTIEFRQAAGTLNAEWAVHWSNLVVGLVDWARRRSHDEITRFLINAQWKENAPLDSTQYSVDHLIREVLKLPEIADYIANTTPERRTYPRLDKKQSEWRRLMRRNGCRCIGKQMWPCDDWPP